MKIIQFFLGKVKYNKVRPMILIKLEEGHFLIYDRVLQIYD